MQSIFRNASRQSSIATEQEKVVGRKALPKIGQSPKVTTGSPGDSYLRKGQGREASEDTVGEGVC